LRAPRKSDNVGITAPFFMPPAAEVFVPLPFNEQAPQENQRISVAYHQFFSGYYNRMYDDLRAMIRFGTGEDKFPVGYSKLHTDGSPFYAAIEKSDEYKSDCVIAPVWYAPPLNISLHSIFEMANAFTKSRRNEYGEETLANRFLAVYPYAELRQDDNSPLYLRSYCRDGYTAREAVTAQILAETTRASGVTEQIFIEPHSEKAMRFFKEDETLCLTAAPVFAKWLLENNLVNEKTAVCALDLGAAQKCQHLASILKRATGWEIDVVILGKKRSGHSEVGEQDFILGNLENKTTAILFDDLVASAGSILKTAQSLRSINVKVIPCITHGILCGKYVENITGSIELGTIPTFAITNSLPQAQRASYLPITSLEVLPIQQMLAFFAREVALRSINEVKNDPRFVDYVLTPKSKLQVGLELGIPFDKITHALELEENSVAMVAEALRLPTSIFEQLPKSLRQKIRAIFR
jgi:phosphoribosylpyrophosphate synthetase